MKAKNLSLCRWHPQENLQCSHFTSLWRDGRELCAELLFAYWTYRFLDGFVAVVVAVGEAPGGGGGGTPIHYLYEYVPPNGVVIFKLLI